VPGLTSTGATFEPGVSVLINDGPLQGVRGIAFGMNERERVFVLVRLLRGSIVVELDPERVRLEHPVMWTSRRPRMH
jgi:hypothetical protein